MPPTSPWRKYKFRNFVPKLNISYAPSVQILTRLKSRSTHVFVNYAYSFRPRVLKWCFLNSWAPCGSGSKWFVGVSWKLQKLFEKTDFTPWTYLKPKCSICCHGFNLSRTTDKGLRPKEFIKKDNGYDLSAIDHLQMILNCCSDTKPNISVFPAI